MTKKEIDSVQNAIVEGIKAAIEYIEENERSPHRGNRNLAKGARLSAVASAAKAVVQRELRSITPTPD